MGLAVASQAAAETGLASLGLGEIFSLACAICWAIGVVMFKHSGESLSANGLNLFKNSFALLLVIPTALLTEGFKIPSFTSFQWFILIISGYLGIAIADSWYFQALRNLGAGRTAIVASLYSPFVIILSIFILGETLETWQLLGFVFIMVGIFLVIYQKNYQQVGTESLRKGIVYATCSVFLTAFGVVIVKPILDGGEHGFYWVVALRLFFGLLGMLIFILLRGQWSAYVREFKGGGHQWLHLATASFFATYLAMLLWLAGFAYTEASTASVLNETANIFIVLLAWLFLKESLHWRKVAGIGLAFVGVLIFLDVI